MTDSKICKRTVPSNEALAGKLGSEALFTLLQPLLYDHGGTALFLPFKSDSSCFLAMLNPQVDLKNVLLSNAVEAFRDDLRKISIAFPKAIITVGHIPGESNPADTMTKIFRDPIRVINSDLYRYGSERFASKQELGKDVVATCQDGVFTYLGLPAQAALQNPGQECRL